ncbi:hypothetical protein FI667_g5923, partial [Globisporangium splendens]
MRASAPASLAGVDASWRNIHLHADVHIFGLKADVANNAVYVDDQAIAYPAGHNLVIYSLDEKRQKFITGTENTEGITSITIASNRRFIAVAEKSDRGLVSIYDLKTLKKRKVLSSVETQGKSPLVHPVISDVDPGLRLRRRLQLIRLLPCLEKRFDKCRVLAWIPTSLCHAWIKQREDYMVAGTAASDLLLFHSGEFVTRLAASPGDGKGVHSILSTSKGVVCGLEDAMVYMYAVANETASTAGRNASELLVLQRKVKVDSFPGQVNTVCCQLGAAFSFKQWCFLSNSSSSEEMKHAVMESGDVEYVLSSFHRPSDNGLMHITGMGVCVRKPILVTCGLDKTVRVWNYLDRCCEVAKQFAEEAHSVSCHPSGLYLLVGFADKLRLMNILMDDIRPFKEFAVKACRECQSSTGGHLFAAVDGSTIQVFSLFSSNFSEEILVTKSDLEEKNTLMVELKNKVDELMLHNEYQLCLKDMTYNENLKDLTEKFTHEIELEKNKYELLREDKNDIEMKYEEKIKQMEEKHLQHMQEIEAEYQHRIMKEVEKYQEGLQQREAQSLHWKNEQARLVDTHEKYVTDVTEDFEQRLNEDKQLRVQMEEEKEELGREYTETISQVEADVDEEAEREATLRFKGENGIMKKEFSALQKDIEDQRDQIKLLLEKEKNLIEEIKNLEKEIQALKREIRARDETIGEKEKRIYDLKKKNQELEKFKFVLDYKIKELKRQIEPRENEIADMKEQIKEMDRELELFHKSNAQLDLMIGEQRKRINGMQDEIAKYRKVLGDQQTWIRRFRCDLYECVQHIQNPKELTLQVAGLYKKYVTNDIPTNDIEAEIQHEYTRQKEYLEKSVHVLKKKYARDAAQHQAENMQATAENMTLIREINELRSALNAAKGVLQMERAAIGVREAKDSAAMAHKAMFEKDPDALIDQQRHEIEELRKAVKVMEERMALAKASEVFPPIRGVDG